VANTLAYYDSATMTVVNSFIVEAAGQSCEGGNMTLYLTTFPRNDIFSKTIQTRHKANIF